MQKIPLFNFQERYDNLLDIVFELCNYNQTHPL